MQRERNGGEEDVNRTALAAEIFARAHLTGEFRLRSGKTTGEYFDKYLFESDPALLKAIARAMIPLVPRETEVLAGLELGGIPLATVLSQVTGLPAYFVRRQAKSYGTCRLAEGGEVENRRLLIVEDVVSSGSQIILSTQALRQLGGRVEHALCVINRESGGEANLAANNIQLHALFPMTDLKNATQLV